MSCKREGTELGGGHCIVCGYVALPGNALEVGENIIVHEQGPCQERYRSVPSFYWNEIKSQKPNHKHTHEPCSYDEGAKRAV